MNNLQTHMKKYLEYCTAQKCLDEKTLKAYQIDLRQFSEQISATEIALVTADIIEDYIARLHSLYKPKTAKRKIASLKAFFHYLEYKDLIERNPFYKIQVRFRERFILPKTIPLKYFLLRFICSVRMRRQPISEGMPCGMRPLRSFYLQRECGYQSFALCKAVM